VVSPAQPTAPQFGGASWLRIGDSGSSSRSGDRTCHRAERRNGFPGFDQDRYRSDRWRIPSPLAAGSLTATADGTCHRFGWPTEPGRPRRDHQHRIGERIIDRAGRLRHTDRLNGHRARFRYSPRCGNGADRFRPEPPQGSSTASGVGRATAATTRPHGRSPWKPTVGIDPNIAGTRRGGRWLDHQSGVAVYEWI